MTRKNIAAEPGARYRSGLILGVALFFWTLPGATPGSAAELRLAVAASLNEVLHEICADYQLGHPDSRCVINAGASGTLAKQIAQGAPTDLFMPAARDWLDYLLAAGLLDQASVAVVAENRLVLVGRPGSVTTLADLPRLRRIALGSPRSVPAGAYAEAALRSAGVYDELAAEHKLVLAQDVRQALVYAERAEVDAAFVYQSDARLARRAQVLLVVDARLHAPIVYPMALTPQGARKPDVRAFYVYLQSPAVAALLQRHGFIPRR